MDAFFELRNAKDQAQPVEVTDPEGKRPLSLSEAKSAQLLQLTEAGYYQFRLANGRQDEIAVNPDPKESNLDMISDDVLALWQGKRDQSSEEASATGASTARKIPQGLWWYVMLLVFAAALAESALASRYLGTQREE